MDIKYLSQSIKSTDNITTKESRILHIVPDFKTNIVSHIKTSLGIRPNSIYAIIAKPEIMKIAGKTFNSKTYINQLKVLIKQRKINVQIKRDIPNSTPRGKFVIVDQSQVSQAIGYVNELASPKQALFFLFQNLKNQMMAIKKEHPGITQSLLFPMERYDKGIIELLNYLRQIPKAELQTEYNAFDDVVLASLAIDEKKTMVIPIMGYNLKGGIDIYKNNLSKVGTALKSLDKERLKKVTTDRLGAGHAKDPKLTDIAGKIDKKATKETHKKSEETGFYEPTVEIDQKRLNQILRGYKIKDMTIANNIKDSIDKYLVDAKSKEDIPTDKDQLEQLILKSIHFSLFQTDEVREEFLHDPGALIRKLIDVNTHSKELHIPKIEVTQSIDPQKIVDLTTVNSVRHEYELDENIHETINDLFKSLENKKSAPIKIVNIKHEYKDDNLNRYIEYTVKMKNLVAGSKEPYEIKMKIPSLVNNRYLKLNGSEYILLSQQFLTPITKDRSNEARFLTHFQMTRLNYRCFV